MPAIPEGPRGHPSARGIRRATAMRHRCCRELRGGCALPTPIRDAPTSAGAALPAPFDPLSILPARGRGGSCTEVSTRDPRGVLPGAGEGASGSSNLRVEASGHESSYGVLLAAFRSHDRSSRLIQFGEGRLFRRGVVLPGPRIPDLHSVKGPHDDTLLVQSGVRPQVRWDRDAALLVRSVVRGT